VESAHIWNFVSRARPPHETEGTGSGSGMLVVKIASEPSVRLA
jgi:hypothetical protein